MRNVLVCHCEACREATGGLWPASAAHRSDLVIVDETTVSWERAPVSECRASRGRCRDCGTVVFWDAPDRETVSFGVATLTDASELEVTGHVWVGEGEATLPEAGPPVYREGLPASVVMAWHD